MPTGLKSMLEAYVMCYLRTCARVVMTSRPGGFSQAWLEQCVTMRIVPLDAQQKELVAQARVRVRVRVRARARARARARVRRWRGACRGRGPRT